MYGSGCLERGAVKISLGSGAFLDLNTGEVPHASMHGLVPLVGWRFGGELVYLAEGFSSDSGTAITWAHNLGLFDRVEDASDIAYSVEDSGGVYFVPAFSGLQAPVNDENACCMFVGLKADTSKACMVRAILESLAFRVYQIYKVMLKEAEFSLGTVRCCGGVSKNDFVCQMISDLIGEPIEKLENVEATTQGIAFLSGLACGFWESEKELEKITVIEKVFRPCDPEKKKSLLLTFSEWTEATKRALSWYKH